MKDVTWYFRHNGKIYGPYSKEKLLFLVSSGRLSRLALVCSSTMTEWESAGRIAGLVADDAIGKTPPPLPHERTIDFAELTARKNKGTRHPRRRSKRRWIVIPVLGAVASAILYSGYKYPPARKWAQEQFNLVAGLNDVAAEPDRAPEEQPPDPPPPAVAAPVAGHNDVAAKPDRARDEQPPDPPPPAVAAPVVPPVSPSPAPVLTTQDATAPRQVPSPAFTSTSSVPSQKPIAAAVPDAITLLPKENQKVVFGMVHVPAPGRPLTDLRWISTDATEVETLSAGGFWRKEGTIGYGAVEKQQDTVPLWRFRHTPDNRYHYRLGRGDGDLLAWVWTQRSPGMIEVFVLENPGTNSSMILVPEIDRGPNGQSKRDWLVSEHSWRQRFSFFLYPASEK